MFLSPYLDCRQMPFLLFHQTATSNAKKVWHLLLGRQRNALSDGSVAYMCMSLLAWLNEKEERER